jgi:hypothetical protein
MGIGGLGGHLLERDGVERDGVERDLLERDRLGLDRLECGGVERHGLVFHGLEQPTVRSRRIGWRRRPSGSPTSPSGTDPTCWHWPA